MSDFFSTLLWPIRWVVELILVAFHSLFTAVGLDPDSGLTWVLSILMLLVIIRLVVLPLNIAAVKSAQGMALISPQASLIQAKYKGKTDPESQTAQAQELLELYREHKVNPLGAIGPILIQLPIFFGLYYVLHEAQLNNGGVGLLNKQLATSFADSTFLGAPLHLSLLNSEGILPVIFLGIILLLIVSVGQFIAQSISLKLNTTEAARQSPLFRFQKFPLIAIPVIFLVTSLAVQLSLLFYLTFSTLWALVQQLFFIHHFPMPYSPAAEKRTNRLERKNSKKDQTAN